MGLRQSAAGRISAMLIDAIVPSGVLWVTIYGHVGVGCTGLNAELLQYLAVYHQGSRTPWVPGGDFDNPSNDLGLLKWSQMLGATVAAPPCATFSAGSGASRCLDIFVVSCGVANCVADLSALPAAP
eukprot:4738239-Pyramimonas_sp.AAC.1